MKKRVFITGGGGMLATALEMFYSKAGNSVLAPRYQELDVLDSLKANEAISAFKPDYIFHTAALHVNDCEENQKLAFELNAKASQNLARICSAHDAEFIYISSCGYFGDEIKYYKESDPVALKTIYAKSKYQGEALSLKECKKTFAIRPGWLFGGKITHKKNFVFQRYMDAQKTKILKAANDKYGCPTYVEDLVVKVDEILNSNRPGIYHVTNSGGCTRAEYIKKIIEYCGLETKVEPIDSGQFPRKANVPNCELLKNHNLKGLGINPLPPWQEAIERYVSIMIKEAGN